MTTGKLVKNGLNRSIYATQLRGTHLTRWLARVHRVIRRLVMPTMLSKGSSEYAAAALGLSVAALVYATD